MQNKNIILVQKIDLYKVGEENSFQNNILSDN